MMFIYSASIRMDAETNERRKSEPKINWFTLLWLLFTLQKFCKLMPYLCTVIQKYMFNLLIFSVMAYKDEENDYIEEVLIPMMEESSNSDSNEIK